MGGRNKKNKGNLARGDAHMADVEKIGLSVETKEQASEGGRQKGSNARGGRGSSHPSQNGVFWQTNAT